MNKDVFEHISENLVMILCESPQASATICGGENSPNISGHVKFYQTTGGVLIYAVITGLPRGNTFHGFHVHEGDNCGGTADNLFANTGSHYNPDKKPHPFHAGDMPPLLNSNGNAISLFLTDRFSVKDVIGKTVVIHELPDDFTTQPSGNSGEKIACGKIIGP